MKKLYFIFTLIVVLVLHACKTKKKKGNDPDFPHMEASIFAQKPPGSTPEIFAPRMISAAQGEQAVEFSPDIKEIYFRKFDEGLKDSALVAIQYKDNEWTETFVVPRGEISPDGKIMHIGNEYREQTPSGWSEIKSLGAPFDSIPIMRLTASSKGTYYFDTSPFYDKSSRVGTISYSRLIDGIREKPRTLDVDMGIEKFHPFIAPDESYLIFDSRSEGGNLDIYISFRQKDGSWGAAIKLGNEINTEFADASGSVTSDGKYFFFTRFLGNGKKNLMWVDTGFIEALRLNPNSQNSASASYPIAYGSQGICLTNIKGTSTIRLTNGHHGYPAWSPDGKKIAFYSYHDEKKTWSIHTINSDGSNKKRLTHAKNKWDSTPSWSADGKKILFAREYKNSEEVWQYEIWIMNSDGSEETQIKSLVGGNPFFTPDGRIVFSAEFRDKKSEICIADVDGRNLSQLTNNDANEWHPKVSPDGKQIAFSSDRDGNHEIYIMNIDGSNQKRLTNIPTDDYGASWSPDSSQIIFQSKGEKGDKETNVYIMNKDGSSVRKITAQSGWQPAWYHKSQ